MAKTKVDHSDRAVASPSSLKPLVSHPLLWVFGPGIGAVAFSWSEWGRKEANISAASDSTSLTQTSTSRFHASPKALTHEGNSLEVHPVYGEITEKVSHHTLSFPPGSEAFSEALRDGGKLLDHVASVYQPTKEVPTSPVGNWQTVTTTHGEFDDHRSATALPPATQQAINAQPKTSVPTQDLQPIQSTEDDWTASIRQNVFAGYLWCTYY